MFFDVVNETINVDNKAYKISDMITVIKNKYPWFTENSPEVEVERDYIMDMTMGMDRGEQMSEMERLMCKAIYEDKKAKRAHDDCGRRIAASVFFAATSLHPIFKKYTR